MWKNSPPVKYFNIPNHLKSLCQDQTRLINPVLFVYRKVPQASTGFNPFQLGRLVGGAETILK